MTTHLLIDADLIAFRASAFNQQTFDWGEGVVTQWADFKAAKRQARDEIDGYMEKLDGDKLTVCLSDDIENYRKDILPTYKGNRTGERPEYLYDLKEWLYERYPSARWSRIEADDLMGVMATEPGTNEERIMVSSDKDMLTIPGLLYRPHLENAEVEDISLADADFYHLFQTLTGDATDNYAGCPGIGPKKARAALTDLVGVARVDREITRGKNKGDIRTTWEPCPYDTPWEVVCSLYAKAGLGQRDALTQARCARILRHGEWLNGRPVLWSPALGN